jgi:hypothetical protein
MLRSQIIKAQRVAHNMICSEVRVNLETIYQKASKNLFNSFVSKSINYLNGLSFVQKLRFLLSNWEEISKFTKEKNYKRGKKKRKPLKLNGKFYFNVSSIFLYFKIDIYDAPLNLI